MRVPEDIDTPTHADYVSQQRIFHKISIDDKAGILAAFAESERRFGIESNKIAVDEDLTEWLFDTVASAWKMLHDDGFEEDEIAKFTVEYVPPIVSALDQERAYSIVLSLAEEDQFLVETRNLGIWGPSNQIIGNHTASFPKGDFVKHIAAPNKQILKRFLKGGGHLWSYIPRDEGYILDPAIVQQHAPY